METAELIGHLKTEMENLTATVIKRDEEIKTLGVAREETGKAIDKLDETIKGISEEIVGKQDELNKRLDELEASKNRLGFPDDGIERRSVGQMFVESDEYKSMITNKQARTGRVDIGAIQLKELSSTATSAGALVEAMRVAGIWARPDRALRLRDVLTVARTTSNAIDFVRETGFSNLYTTITSNASSGQAVVVVALTAGMYVGLTITLLDPVTTNTETAVVLTVDSTTQVTMTANLTNTYLAANVSTATAGVFGGISEGTAKPEMNLEYTLVSTSVKTIAHWLPVTRQILADAAQLENVINQRLIYGLKLSEEEQILYGDGTADNLEGLLVNAGRQTLSWSALPTGSTKIDAIRRAINLATVIDYPVDAMVLHPNDWVDIELTKGSDGHYIHAIVSDGATGGARLWRVPIVETTAIRTGTSLMGAFSLAATLWDREDATIDVSDSHADFFTTNRLAIRAEERLALANYRPEGFVDLTFDAAP